MSVRIYIEGGGDSKDLHIRCREGFRRLLEKCGFEGRMPRLFESGSGYAALQDFTPALAGSASSGIYPMLLIDSEEPIATPSSPSQVWDHIVARWRGCRPPGSADDQAQAMVTCVETWVLADRGALRHHYGSELQESPLLPETGLEARARGDVQDALERATRNCGRDRSYAKGRRSFVILAELDPETLKLHLPHFVSFLQALDRHS